MTAPLAKFQPRAGASSLILLAIGIAAWAAAQAAPLAAASGPRVTFTGESLTPAALVYSKEGLPRATLYMPSEGDLARSAATSLREAARPLRGSVLLRAFRDRHCRSDSPPPSEAHHGVATWEETLWDGWPAIRATLTFDDPRATITLTIRENFDPELPVSQMVEILFSDAIAPAVVERVPHLAVKGLGQERSRSLAGIAVAVTERLFWIALSDDPDDVAQNIELLRDSTSIELPLRFAGGAEALLTFETGASGDRVIDMVTAKWEASP
jgi:hypothetical protein